MQPSTIRLLAIDPGADTGWALYRSGLLEQCGLGEPPPFEVDELIVEKPMIYPGGKSRPNDIITLAIRAGEMRGRWPNRPCTYVLPRVWKGGSISKPVSHARIWARLNQQEAGIASLVIERMAAGKRHNVLDALGIGLYGVGRMGR